MLSAHLFILSTGTVENFNNILNKNCQNYGIWMDNPFKKEDHVNLSTDI